MCSQYINYHNTNAKLLEATRHWFDFLETLLKIVDEDDRRKARHKTSTET